MATVIQSQFHNLVTQATALTAVAWCNYAAAAGVAVPSNARGETTHLIVAKNALVTVGVYGYQPTLANWVRVDTVSFSFSNCTESQRMAQLGGFSRVQAQPDSIGASGSANIYWAFGQE